MTHQELPQATVILMQEAGWHHLVRNSLEETRDAFRAYMSEMAFHDQWVMRVADALDITF